MKYYFSSILTILPIILSRAKTFFTTNFHFEEFDVVILYYSQWNLSVSIYVSRATQVTSFETQCIMIAT